MSANILDKLVTWFDPAAGYRRARYREAANVKSAYEGAKTGRRAASWNTTGTSANSEINAALPALRNRSRDLIRNNALIANARGKWADSIVGSGILCQWEDDRLQASWDAWCKQASADGLAHFEALEHLACGSEFESGEVLLRIRPRFASDGVKPPFQIQVLESDFLDSGKTGPIDGGYCVHGVEFNRLGQRVAYWLFERHPGDVGSNGPILSSSSKRVPARQISHVYFPTRPGQVRGVPRPTPSLLPARDVAEWEEAEIVRKRTEACIAAAVTSAEGDQFTFTESVQDAAGNDVAAFEPGMLLKLKPGEDISWNQPSYAGGYDDYKVARQREFAAGMQMPFELITGNYSKSNYSSSRMGAVAFKRTVEAVQWNIIIPLVCEFTAAEFLRLTELLDGPVKNPRRTWNPPAFELLDRLNEAEADEKELRIGKVSWPQMVARSGNDPRQQLEEIDQHAEGLRTAGIDFFGGKAKQNDNSQPTES